MLAEVLRALRCPVCWGGLADEGKSLRCAAGHSFDVARQGYVNLSGGDGGDTAAMVEARARFLGAGHYARLAEAVSEVAGTGLVIEVGAGTGYFLAAVVERSDGRVGLAVDVSRAAARRAARAHPRVAAVVADAARLPVADRVAGMVLDVFAPRPAGELARVLAEDGVLVVVTPAADHLRELRGIVLDVDPDKERRLEERLGPLFVRGASRRLAFEMRLGRAEVAAVVGMGPSAWHTDDEVIGPALARLPEPISVTAAFQIEVDRLRSLT